MTDSMEASYNDWTGRKTTSLSRPTLDCGCPNPGEVSYHLWCDRLACQEHAEDPHDCAGFGGAKSGIEEEAVEPEAVVEEPASSPGQPWSLSPESYRALYGRWFDETHRAREDAAIQAVWDSVPCDTASPPVVGVTTAGDGPVWVDETHTFERAYLNERVGALRPFLTTALDSESDAFTERVSAALDEFVEPDRDALRRRVADLYDVPRELLWPPADAAPEPDPRTCPTCGEATEPGVGPCDGCRDWTGVQLERWRAEADAQDRPWWRRMFPGGTR